MKQSKPFTCSICHLKVDDVYHCRKCGAYICLRCVHNGDEVRFAVERVCKKCSKENK